MPDVEIRSKLVYDAFFLFFDMLSLILTTFLPTILMDIIGHMSNYYREEFFEGIMAVSVTVMLVLTTLFLRKVF